MSTSGRELNKGRTLKSNYAKRKQNQLYLEKKNQLALFALCLTFIWVLLALERLLSSRVREKDLRFIHSIISCQTAK